MIPRSIVDVDADDAVWEALAKLRSFIRATARGLAEGDLELFEDLEQEAAIVLWKMDPTRFDAEDEAYLQGVLHKRMLKVRRKERHRAGGSRRVEYSEVDESNADISRCWDKGETG